MTLEKRKYKKFKEGEYSIRDDDVFKIIFGTNERARYLKELLEALLDKNITNIVIRNDVALDKTHADNKLMRLDILAEINGNEMVNIEFQNKNEYNVMERSEVYASGIYYNSLKVGDNYIQATKTIVIWILGFNLFKDGNYHEIARTKRDYNNEEVSKNIVYHYFQLPRFVEQTREIKTPEEQWLAYLSGSLDKKEKEELFKMNRSIEEIDKIVDIVLTDKDVQDELNNRILAKNLEDLKKRKAYEDGQKAGKAEGKLEGKLEGMREGKIEGRAEGVKEIAKKMLEKGENAEYVMEITGLTEEEIKSIE